MENIDDYLSNLSIESLMDLSETTSSSTFEENSIVRELISRFKLSQSNFTWGLIVLRDNILIEITKRYIQLNIKPMTKELTPHIEYHPNGNVYIKGQKNFVGQREGLWEYFWNNGNIERRIPYKEGKRDGIAESFYEDGNIRRRIPYKEGKMDGIEEWFDKQWNIKARIPFKEGKEDGIAERFDEQGNIVETRHWKEGELIETTEPELTPYIMYHNNGNVWVKGQKNSGGQEEGICEWFYKNGNTNWRIPYKGGKQDGIVELFYENGNTKWRIPYKNGMEDGVQECFDEQGNIIKTYVWKDGQLIEETQH